MGMIASSVEAPSPQDGPVSLQTYRGGQMNRGRRTAGGIAGALLVAFLCSAAKAEGSNLGYGSGGSLQRLQWNGAPV